MTYQKNRESNIHQRSIKNQFLSYIFIKRLVFIFIFSIFL